MKQKPWFKFWVNDWLSDPHLRACTPAAQGLLINLLAFAHNGEPYGYLTNEGLNITPETAPKMLGWHHLTLRKAWANLELNCRLHRANDGVWYVKRMVSDHAYELQQRQLGKLGGNPALKAPLKLYREGEEKRERLATSTPDGVHNGSSRFPEDRGFGD